MAGKGTENEKPNWKQQISDAIDEATADMLEETPAATEEEHIRVEILCEAIKWRFIHISRTPVEEQFLIEHIEDYKHAIKICMHGSNLEFQKELLKLQRMQNAYIMEKEQEEYGIS